jgi:SAM-dependent methyltransferase
MWQHDSSGVSVEGIDILVRSETHIPVKPFNGRVIPYPDNSVDVIIFVDVLHHTHDARFLLREAARVTRRKVLVKDHLAENAIDHTILRFMDWVGNAPHGVALPYNYFSYGEWMDHFSQAGLKILSLDTKIPLYPVPFNLMFGGRLHFLAELERR